LIADITYFISSNVYDKYILSGIKNLLIQIKLIPVFSPQKEIILKFIKDLCFLLERFVLIYQTELYNISIDESTYLRNYYNRNYFVNNYSWGVPSFEAIETIAKYTQNNYLLEIFAGNGLWSFLLCLWGLKVIATDSFSWTSTQNPNIDKFTYIEQLDAIKAVQKYQNINVLFMCWAPFIIDDDSDSPDYDALYNFKGKLGCIESEKFADYLYENYELVDEVTIPNWSGIFGMLHDFLGVYKKI